MTIKEIARALKVNVSSVGHSCAKLFNSGDIGRREVFMPAKINTRGIVFNGRKFIKEYLFYSK